MGNVVLFLSYNTQQMTLKKNQELMETFDKINITQLKKLMSLKLGFNVGMLHIMPFIRTKLVTSFCLIFPEFCLN